MISDRFDTGVQDVGGFWPGPPTRWSYSALRDIRACPRRWALERASYPEVWEGYGYPPQPGTAAIAGTAVHRCLEWILEALQAAQCAGPGDPGAVEVLRSLGGFSELLDRAIHLGLSDLAGNPRMARSLPKIRMSLTRQVPDLRLRLQSLVARTSIPSQGHRDTQSSKEAIQPLFGRGSFAEVELKADDPPLRGYVDLLTLSDEAVSIVDYKSGRQHEVHEEQLWFYQALWILDERRNPSGIPVSSLELVYPDDTVSVMPLGQEAMQAYISNLRRENVALSDEIARRPPYAHPSEENCGHCSVRHLCGDYWESDLPADLPAEGFGDAAVRIVARRGDRSWRVAHTATGTQTLLHVLQDDVVLRSDDVVRLLGVGFTRPDPEEPPVITLSSFSECYVVSQKSAT